jgi:hypothetical protein
LVPDIGFTKVWLLFSSRLLDPGYWFYSGFVGFLTPDIGFIKVLVGFLKLDIGFAKVLLAF